MYKDDNIIGGCNDSLLRMMIEGRGNSSGSDDGCSCENDGCHNDNSHSKSWGLYDYPLASVFAPLQSFDDLYDKDTALKEGTAFRVLNLPFKGDRRVTKGGSCRG